MVSYVTLPQSSPATINVIKMEVKERRPRAKEILPSGGGLAQQEVEGNCAVPASIPIHGLDLCCGAL